MSAETIDYAAILADLEAKKAALELTIASFRQAMAIGALGQTGDMPGVVPSMGMSSMMGGEVPTGAFLGKSIPEAAKFYLEIVKKKQTSREIAEGLRKGGMESTSKNFVGIVHAVLDRARKAPNAGIVKIGSQWGLAGWFPKGILSATATQSKTGKKKRGKAKAALPKELKASASPDDKASPAPALPPGKANDRALAFLRTKPDGEFSLEEVAKHLGMGVNGARLVLGKMVKAGKCRMSAPGTYTVAPTRLTAVAG